MAKKKSVKKAVDNFLEALEEIERFFEGTELLEEEFKNWCAEYSIIRLHTDFEILMLECLVAVINIDASKFSEISGYKFPKHMNEDLCTYLIVGTGYFDFKGREGLLQLAKKYGSSEHYLYKTLKEKKYKETLEQIITLRNFSSHRSEKAKEAAVAATKTEKLKSAGSWLRTQKRFLELSKSLKKLARALSRKAPF